MMMIQTLTNLGGLFCPYLPTTTIFAFLDVYDAAYVLQAGDNLP
jgi:hypothetical protein